MPASLTVLGSCGAWPEAGRACSGFLLEHGGFRVVLDLGHGTLPRLLTHCPGGEVDAVVITHEHPDHCVDLNALYRVRIFSRAPRIPLFCTPGVLDRVGGLEPRGDLRDAFDVNELPASTSLGPFRLVGTPLPHHVPNVGIRLTAPGLTVAYTGDTGPDRALASLGAGADLFIVDATLQRAGGEPRYLLTATEAGVWAARAEATRLLLTHFWPGTDRDAAAAQAAAGFGGEVLAAAEGLVVNLL